MADIITVITLLVVTIGTIASIAVAIYTFQRPKAEVTVKCVPFRSTTSQIRSAALGEPESVNDEVHIIVANVGHKNIKLNLPNILLQDGRNFETSPVEYPDKYRRSDPARLSINCDQIMFPYLLIPGDSCEVWTSLMSLADWLKRNDSSGDVAVRFQFSDETSNRTYESGKYSINVDEVLERTRPTET
jgi:hypothetical protein